MLISKKYKFVYLDVPKTASSSLDEVFTEYGGKLQKVTSRGRQYLKHCRLIPNYATNFVKIASVRNPYARIVSHYNFNKRNETAIREFSKYWGEGHLDSFDSYIDLCLKINEEYNYDTDYMQAYNRFPQWKYLELTGYDYIIHTESLEKDLKVIPFIKSINIPHKNKMEYNSWQEWITPERNEKIIEWAGKDFNLFGYEKI